jgi:CheY-like chemotaxis protein
VHDLLDLAKVEAGKVTLRPTTFAVQELFGALRGLMRPVQTTEEVALIFDSAERLPLLYTDEGKVSQIVRNYISNALKFTERGEVRVAGASAGDGTVTITVTDTGIGIAEADQQRLFHEFGQIPNRLQAKVRGTGLGLSLSKRLAELLGGSVGVISAPGEGSTFWLRLPMTAPGVEAPFVVAAPTATPPRDMPLALVIDDEQTARYLLRRYLDAVGCRVIEADGGLDGLARAESDHPDVIFLDLRMPDMLGTEVLARLKRNPVTAAVPVIISTSQHVAADEWQRLSTHAAALVGKSRLAAEGGEEEIRRALRSAKLNV